LCIEHNIVQSECKKSDDKIKHAMNRILRKYHQKGEEYG
jgi:hypothetical protein